MGLRVLLKKGRAAFRKEVFGFAAARYADHSSVLLRRQQRSKTESERNTGREIYPDRYGNFWIKLPEHASHLASTVELVGRGAQNVRWVSFFQEAFGEDSPA